MRSSRKVDRRGDGDREARRPRRAGPVELGADGVWHVRGHAAGRAVLRSADTVRAGLGVETVEKLPPRSRCPFGDGPHRCPGAYVAIQEPDIFLSRLFAPPGLRLTGPPRIAMKPDIGAYELHDLRVAIDPHEPAGTTRPG